MKLSLHLGCECLSIHPIVKLSVTAKPFENMHKCNDCGKSFAKPEHLARHKRTVHSSRSIPCLVCGKLFKSKDSLTMHNVVHTNVRKYGCSVCGKKFGLIGNLSAHEARVHRKERLHHCGICNKLYTSKDHERVHTQEKPYKCDECWCNFSYKESFNSHACDKHK